MRRKRTQNIPENAFIPRPARIIAILQLCLAFTLFCWVLSWPFMGEMLTHKKRIFLFQTVMGSGDLIARTYADRPELLDQFSRNKERFLALAPEMRTPFIDAYNKEQDSEAARSFVEKCKGSLVCLLITSSPWLRGWLLLSVITAILLLKKSPGAPYAGWILPIIVLGWCLNTMQHPVARSEEERLFPSEDYLITTYGDGPLEGNPFTQKAALQEAWQRYLLSEWSTNGDLEEGEWRFQRERLSRALQDPRESGSPSPSLLVLFFVWNGVFAWVGYRWRDPVIRQAYA